MATTRRNQRKTRKTRRTTELRHMLEQRRRELQTQVQGKIRDVRAESGEERDAPGEDETSEVNAQGDIDFALIQMKAETLSRVDAALRRLDQGSYGDCTECGCEIPEPRLRALVFAVRCKPCEEASEAGTRVAAPGASRGLDVSF